MQKAFQMEIILLSRSLPPPPHKKVRIAAGGSCRSFGGFKKGKKIDGGDKMFYVLKAEDLECFSDSENKNPGNNERRRNASCFI